MARDKLNEREQKFCDAYLNNGFNAMKAGLAAGMPEKEAHAHSYAILKRPRVQAFLEKRAKKVEDKLGVTFDWKIRKLKKIVDALIPDGEERVSHENANAGRAAIAELNKMQGHLSAEKHVNANINIDADIESAKELLVRLIEKHKREY